MKKITSLIIAGIIPLLIFWVLYNIISKDISFLFFAELITLFLVGKWQSKNSISWYLKLIFLIIPFCLVFYSLMIEKTIVLWVLTPILITFTTIGLLIKNKGTTIFFGVYAIIIGLTVSLVILPEIAYDNNNNIPKKVSSCKKKKLSKRNKIVKANCYL